MKTCKNICLVILQNRDTQKAQEIMKKLGFQSKVSPTKVENKKENNQNKSNMIYGKIFSPSILTFRSSEA
jgi:hypothetical protein